MIAGFGRFDEALNSPSRVGQITRLASQTTCFDLGKMTTMVIYGMSLGSDMRPCADALLQLDQIRAKPNK